MKSKWLTKLFPKIFILHTKRLNKAYNFLAITILENSLDQNVCVNQCTYQDEWIKWVTITLVIFLISFDNLITIFNLYFVISKHYYQVSALNQSVNYTAVQFSQVWSVCSSLTFPFSLVDWLAGRRTRVADWLRWSWQETDSAVKSAQRRSIIRALTDNTSRRRACIRSFCIVLDSFITLGYFLCTFGKCFKLS